VNDVFAGFAGVGIDGVEVLEDFLILSVEFIRGGGDGGPFRVVKHADGAAGVDDEQALVAGGVGFLFRQRLQLAFYPGDPRLVDDLGQRGDFTSSVRALPLRAMRTRPVSSRKKKNTVAPCCHPCPQL
jgi:hypothetical protein